MEAQVAEVVEPKYPLARIDPISEIVKGLDTKYADVIYDVTNNKGMAVARTARAELRGLRTRLEEARKGEKAYYLEGGRFVDKIAKTLDDVIVKYYDPLNELIHTEEEQKEKEKREREEAEKHRVDGIEQKIDKLRNAVLGLQGKPSCEIQLAFDNLAALEISEVEYQEFRQRAFEVHASALKGISQLLTETIVKEEEQERLRIEREALEKQRKEQEAREAEAKKSRLEEERKLAEARKAEERRLAEEKHKQDEALRLEREAHETQIRAEREEADKKRREAEAIEAENRRKAEELEAQKREQEEQARLLSEHRKRLAEARRESPVKALIDILELAEDFIGHPNHQAVRAEIALISEASLPRTRARKQDQEVTA